MTVRFSIADVAEMIKQPIDRVRLAIEKLDGRGDLTAESFLFADKSWRIAPLDIKKIQAVIAELPSEASDKPKRRVVRKVVKTTEEQSD
ncbi:MAG TPA: hypothetical protein VFV52_12000 [Bacilli bacterium]|nr:hypothetical protein [Bacilli bacterium]